MRAILLITFFIVSFDICASDPKFLTIRPSIGIFKSGDNSYNQSESPTRSFSSHIQLELARIKRFQISIGLFTFFNKHGYVMSYSYSSYTHSPSAWSSHSTNTTYSCTLEELTHNATFSIGWNSKYIRNRIHFAINGGILAPLYNKYKISNMTGIRTTSNSYSNPIDGEHSSSMKESVIATEQNLRIPKKIEPKGTKFFSVQTSYLFHSKLELGLEYLLVSQPIRVGIVSEYDYNTYYLVSNIGLQLTYNL